MVTPDNGYRAWANEDWFKRSQSNSPIFLTQKPIEASDKPDEAFQWILEVYDKTASYEVPCDPKKCLTIDTKLLAVLTKLAKGELARQILNFKEVEAGFGRAVRDRQILCRFRPVPEDE